MPQNFKPCFLSSLLDSFFGIFPFVSFFQDLDDLRLAILKRASSEFLEVFHADDPRQDPEYPALSAARHHPGRRRLRKHATVTGTAQVRRENRTLAVKSKDRAVDVRFLRQNADLIRKVARRKIICSVNDDVIVLNDLHRVLTSKHHIVQVDPDIWIDGFDPIFGRVELLAANVLCTVQNLTLEIGKIHHIKISQTIGSSCNEA